MDTAYLNEGNMPENKKKNNKKLIIIIAIALLALIVGGIFLFGGKGKSLEHYLDLGDKYLDEANFDEALAAYDKALEIDDMCVEAYLGKIEVLIRTEKFDEALEVAKEGYDKTGDERLAEKIEMLESGNISDSEGRIYKETYRDADGSILGYNIFSYDYEHDGRTSIVTHYDENGNEAHSVEWEYDDNGSALVSSGTLHPEGTLIKFNNTYDDERMVHDSFEYLNGSGGGEVDRYYEGDLCTKEVETRYGENSEPYTTTRTYEYNSDNKIIKQTYSDEDGEITGYDTFSYDENGNEVEYAHYSKDYNITTGQQNDSFLLTNRTESVYNDEGKLIKSVTYDGEGNVMSSIDYQ